MFSDVKGARLPMSCATQSGEPASKYFVAHLGEATAEVEARLLQWAAGCVAHSLARDERNQVSLYFERAEARTVRQMQSLLRTLSSKWKLPLGPLEKRWMRARKSAPPNMAAFGCTARVNLSQQEGINYLKFPIGRGCMGQHRERQ